MEQSVLINIILTIVLAAFMGACCGLFSYFLDYTFWDKSIFKSYLPWLAKVNIKYFRKGDYSVISKIKNPAIRAEQYTSIAEEKCFFYKMLGGCAVCLNMWIALLSWTLFCLFTPIAWYYAPAYIFTSSALIRKFVGTIY